MSTPLEQDLKLLAARAEELPYIDDPWRRFSALEATHRRRRRAGFATGALCAALAVGGLGSGVLPLPAWTPAVTVDPGWASTPLLDGGIRGGMTHAWVTNCRHRLEGTRHST